MLLIGTVLRAEPVSGTSDSGAYSYWRLHVLDGIDVIRARVSDDYLSTVGEVPAEGSQIVAEVSVNAYKTRNGVGIGVTLLRPGAERLDAALSSVSS